jgi:anti-sigma factor RsiW
MTASYTMPMTKQEQPADATGARRTGLLGDEQWAATLSAYLDGHLDGEDLTRFETLLENDAALAREVREFRNIETQLMKMGSDILTETIPEALLEAFKRVERG